MKIKIKIKSFKKDLEMRRNDESETIKHKYNKDDKNGNKDI